MGNNIIHCFNKEVGDKDELRGQCIYAKCPMFSEELDMCKLEYLKGTPMSTPTQPEETVQEEKSPLQKIKAGDYVPSITVTMLEAAKPKTVTAQGEEKEIIEVMVTDDYENALLTVWPPLAQNVKTRPSGTKLHLEALGSSEYQGQLQLKSTRKTTISYS